MMLSIAFALSFLVYHVTVCRYAAYIYEYRKNLILLILVSFLANYSILFWGRANLGVHTEAYFIIFYIISYSILFRFMSKKRFLVNAFGIFAFTLNLFSRRILMIAIASVFLGISFGEVLITRDLYIIVSIIPFLIAPYSIGKTRKKLSKDILDVVFSDRKNLSFAVSIMGIVVIYSVCMLFSVNILNNGIKYDIFYVVIGVLANITYLMAIFYSYTFSKLKINEIEFRHLDSSIRDEEIAVNRIVEQYSLDPNTKLDMRKVAEKEIKQYLKDNKAFYVVFIDIDECSLVNNNYGQTEAEFYIEQVAKSVKTSFRGEIITKVGIDGFLIVGRGGNIYTTTQKMMCCYHQVKGMQKQFNKGYQTSVSYGISNVSADTNLSYEQIIEEARLNMMDFKSEKKRK